MKGIKSTKGIYIAVNVLVALFGIVLMAFPKISLSVVGYIGGALLLALGIIRITAYFVKDLYNIAFQFDLALGLLSFFAGLIVLIKPHWFTSIIPFAIGITIFISGLFAVQSSIDARKFGLHLWWLMLILAAASVAVGIVLIFNPFESSVWLMVFFGCTLVVSSVERIIVCACTVFTKKKKKGVLDDGTPFTEVEYKDV